MPALKTPPSLAVMAEIIDDPPQSVQVFRRITADDLIDESALLSFLQNVYGVLDELAGEALANAHFNRLSGFIETCNLRYELRRPVLVVPDRTRAVRQPSSGIARQPCRAPAPPHPAAGFRPGFS